MENRTDLEVKKEELKKLKSIYELNSFITKIPYYFIAFINLMLIPRMENGIETPRFAYYEAQILDDGTISIDEDDKKYEANNDFNKLNSISKTEVVYNSKTDKYEKIEYEYEIPNLVFSDTKELINNIDEILDYFNYTSHTSYSNSETCESEKYEGTVYIKDPKDFKRGSFDYGKYLLYSLIATLLGGSLYACTFCEKNIMKAKKTKKEIKKLKLELKELRESGEEYKRY